MKKVVCITVDTTIANDVKLISLQQGVTKGEIMRYCLDNLVDLVNNEGIAEDKEIQRKNDIKLSFKTHQQGADKIQYIANSYNTTIGSVFRSALRGLITREVNPLTERIKD